MEYNIERSHTFDGVAYVHFSMVSPIDGKTYHFQRVFDTSLQHPFHMQLDLEDYENIVRMEIEANPYKFALLPNEKDLPEALKLIIEELCCSDNSFYSIETFDDLEEMLKNNCYGSSAVNFMEDLYRIALAYKLEDCIDFPYNDYSSFEDILCVHPQLLERFKEEH